MFNSNKYTLIATSVHFLEYIALEYRFLIIRQLYHDIVYYNFSQIFPANFV